MAKLMKKNTIYGIAEQCGVSITTVSRVLNGNPLVSEKTRSKIQAAIEQNHFSPNPMARGLNNKSSKSIGIILSDITNPYFASLFLEIERYAIEQDYSVILYNTMYGSYSRNFSKSVIEESHYFQMAMDKRLDGVIITGGQIDMDTILPEYLDALNGLQKEMPVVIIGQKFEGISENAGSKCSFVERSLEKGIASAVRHLHSLGHKKIGFIGGEVGVRITSDRFTAYKKTLSELGIQYNENFVHFSDYYVRDGYTAMQEQLRSAMRPTSLVAINDMVALGALRALSEASLKVPDDIALVSCDQFFFGDFTTPSITTLDRQNDYIGRLAIVELLNLMRGMNGETTAAPNPCLIIRESCGAHLGKRNFSD
jgi:LacI family transcriptional regulator